MRIFFLLSTLVSLLLPVVSPPALAQVAPSMRTAEQATTRMQQRVDSLRRVIAVTSDSAQAYHDSMLYHLSHTPADSSAQWVDLRAQAEALQQRIDFLQRAVTTMMGEMQAYHRSVQRYLGRQRSSSTEQLSPPNATLTPQQRLDSLQRAVAAITNEGQPSPRRTDAADPSAPPLPPSAGSAQQRLDSLQRAVAAVTSEAQTYHDSLLQQWQAQRRRSASLLTNPPSASPTPKQRLDSLQQAVAALSGDTPPRRKRVRTPADSVRKQPPAQDGPVATAPPERVRLPVPSEFPASPTRRPVSQSRIVRDTTATAPAATEGQVGLSGYVRDATSGESLIGATVYLPDLGRGTVTNAEGRHALAVPPGEYEVTYSYVGYQSVTQRVSLAEDTRLLVELAPASQELAEVVVTAEEANARVRNTEMSVNRLDIQTIQKIPAFLGEVDVIKSIQLLPGVTTVGEGASGFNVRGGGVGQNLILLDEAPVYNSSHLFGFFSVFNPDAVQSTQLYKGAVPARYGGRIASLLDVQLKEGNDQELDVSGGIGTVFSRLAVEGPLIKDKASFIVAARRSYIDVLLRPFADQIGIDEDFGLYFYDLTLKTHYRLNDNNRVFLSGYLGRDNFKFDEQQGFSWGNATGTARWNHLFSDRLFSDFTFVFSDYNYELAFGEDAADSFNWSSSVTNFTFKPQFSYAFDNYNELTFGGEATYYRFEPANAVGVANGTAIDISLDEKFNVETALYVGNRQDIGSALSLEYGLRFSAFGYYGPGTVYSYGDTLPGVRRPVTGQESVAAGEPIATYTNLEPRASFRVQVGERGSIKGSYTRMAQYLHLVSNTTASNPLDVWVPSSNNIAPQLGDQWALGYFRDFGAGSDEAGADYELSVEGYYRATQNQIDYIDGADLLINEFVEGDLLVGQGRAYGLEFYLKKNVGRLNGWVSYTLGKTELQVAGINQGRWYPTRFDQRHNLKVAAFYDLNDRWSVSGNFTYLSGTPATFPTSRFEVQGILIPYNANDSRNNTRIPDYHRLDLSVRWEGRRTRRNGKPRRNEDYWVFSLYNVYGRRNPFSIFFAQTEQPGGVSDSPGGVESSATQLSIVGSIVPSVSYNFKF